MLKKFLLIIIAACILFCACTPKEDESTSITLDKINKRGYIIAGVKTDTYPFGYKTAKGNYRGFDVDLAKIIAKHLLGNENKVKFVTVTSSDRISKLYSEDIDMIIATMTVTPQRKELLDFSDSYHIAGQSMLVKKGSKIKNLSDLQGKHAIIVYGTTGERSIRNAIPNLRITGFLTYKEAFKALKAKKADAVISDDTILLGYALRDNSVELIPKRFTREPYAIAFRKGLESKDLITKVNAIIDSETKNGHLKKIKKSYRIK